MRPQIVRIAIGLAITLFFIGHAARLYSIGFIERLDHIIYDARLKLTMPGSGDRRIVILDIDEKSLGEIGHWPWSRDIMARLVDKLFDRYQIAILGFDVVWAERDTSSGVEVLDGLARQELKDVPGFQSAYSRVRPALDFDALFAASLKGRPVVLGYYFSGEHQAVKANAIPEPVLPRGIFAGRNVAFPRWRGYTGNLEIYQRNAAGAGHINPLVDADGVSRRVPMLVEFDGSYYEPLSLAMVRTLMSVESGSAPKIEPGYPAEPLSGSGRYPGLEWLKVGPIRIPLDDQASALIPYHGSRFSFPYVSLVDILNDRVKPEQLKGKVAIVGTTAPGLQDVRSTPVDSAYPGVEIHANMIAAMINDNLKQKPPYILGAEVMLLLVGGVAFSVLVPMLSALWASVAAALGAGALTGINLLLWANANTVLPLAASLLMIAFLYTMNMAYGYFVESRAKRQFTELFGQYVPPELVDQMAADPEKYSMEPRAAALTILFVDVRGFTGISEALKPEELREYINAYLTAMSQIIRGGFHGTLDKYIGDAIMAFWGAPIEDPEHARHGVLAGLAMQKACRALNENFAARGWPTLKIGVGVNTGNVRVGDMGSQLRRAYTVMGDPVNVASRLEGRTKFYGVGILVGEATRNAVKDVVFREVDRVKVKGKEDAVTIYEPIGPDSEVDQKMRDELELWKQTLQAHRAQQWDRVQGNLLDLQRMNPDCLLYRLYAERAADFRRAPPPRDWDGVTSFDAK